MKALLTLCAVAALLAACGPPQLTLAQLASPRLAATRDGTAAVKATLSWDDKKTPCGAITNLTGRIDAEAATITNGALAADGMTCTFPTLSLAPMRAMTDRTITFDDGATKLSVTVTLLEAPTASPTSTNRTPRVGTPVVWTFNTNGAGVGSWRIFYTPTSGTEATWAEGTGPIASVGTDVPASAANTSGTLGLWWRALTVIRECKGAVDCQVDVTDRAAYAVSITP
jgi:hypothetical protein